MKIFEIKEFFFISITCIIGVILGFFYFFNFKTYNQGLYFFNKKMYEKAEDKFVKFLSQNAYSYKARLNLALIDSIQKEYKRALGEYKVVVEDSSDKEDRFHAHFNSAHVYTNQSNLDRALNSYQKSLDEKPGSMEVKTNIELIMMSLNSKQKKESNSSQDKPSSGKNSFETNLGQKKQDTKEEKREKGKEGLNEEQMNFILKSLEKNEKKLRSKIEGKRKYQNQNKKQW